jgi:hypothetical protein
MNHAVLFLAIALSANAISARAQSDTVSAGGIYSLSGTFAKAEASTISGGSFAIENGAFETVLIVETPAAPTIRIQYQGADIIVTWAGAIDAYQLEQTAALLTTWSTLPATQQNAGGEIKVTIPVSAQNQFLRLRKTTP